MILHQLGWSNQSQVSNAGINVNSRASFVREERFARHLSTAQEQL